jgi:hypothetical protein
MVCEHPSHDGYGSAKSFRSILENAGYTISFSQAAHALRYDMLEFVITVKNERFRDELDTIKHFLGGEYVIPFLFLGKIQHFSITFFGGEYLTYTRQCYFLGHASFDKPIKNSLRKFDRSPSLKIHQILESKPGLTLPALVANPLTEEATERQCFNIAKIVPVDTVSGHGLNHVHRQEAILTLFHKTNS